jgi:hypothetical protein
LRETVAWYVASEAMVGFTAGREDPQPWDAKECRLLATKTGASA